MKLLPLLTGCVLDSKLAGPADATPFDTGDALGESPPVESDPVPPATEACDGYDNDGDGEVDEGFPDEDGNGRVDCLDEDCPPLSAGVARPVEVLTRRLVDPWTVRVKWEVVAPSVDPAATNVIGTPSVGHLDDDDGDGAIGPGDIPDVVAVFYSWPALADYVVALDGATGAEKWTWTSGDAAFYSHSPIVADLDGDGTPEVVLPLAAPEILALGPDGTERWRSTGGAIGDRYQQVADLEGDGTAEIVTPDGIVDGATGAVTARFEPGRESTRWRFVTVADLDRDGAQEILVSGKVYDASGTLLWDSGEQNEWGLHPVPVQADGDDDAEIAWVGDDLTVWEADGTLRARVPLSLFEPGPPCAGDLDGDGAMELAFPDNLTMYAYELDGTELWTAPVDDTSGAAGCTAWDLDGDGALEVVFGGEATWYVFDGATGAPRLAWPEHRSGTAAEIPVVADVDADGRGELVAVSQALMGASSALRVLEHDGGGWAPAGPVFPSRDYSQTNFEDDGGVPPAPAPWLDPGVFRGRGSAPLTAPDLVVEIRDQCLVDCTYGPAAVAVQVANVGTADAPASTLALYALDGEAPRFVAAVSVPAVASGMSADDVVTTLEPDQLGTNGLRAVIDDGDGIRELDEGNNTEDAPELACP